MIKIYLTNGGCKGFAVEQREIWMKKDPGVDGGVCRERVSTKIIGRKEICRNLA